MRNETQTVQVCENILCAMFFKNNIASQYYQAKNNLVLTGCDEHLFPRHDFFHRPVNPLPQR